MPHFCGVRVQLSVKYHQGAINKGNGVKSLKKILREGLLVTVSGRSGVRMVKQKFKQTPKPYSELIDPPQHQ